VSREIRMPRGAKRTALVLVGVMVLSVAVAAAGFAATSLYGQYGGGRAQDNARSWAIRPVIYSRSDCRACHEDQNASAAGGPHVSLICEACHVPSPDHPGPVTGTVVAMDTPSSDLCVTCHAKVPGRPALFPQVDMDQHFLGADCLRCHDPHTTTAVSPPVVTHPLANLPECITCHAPGRLKRFPEGHQPAPDRVCLTCHLTPDRRP
jgi:hypothetical protein